MSPVKATSDEAAQSYLDLGAGKRHLLNVLGWIDKAYHAPIRRRTAPQLDAVSRAAISTSIGKAIADVAALQEQFTAAHVSGLRIRPPGLYFPSGTYPAMEIPYDLAVALIGEHPSTSQLFYGATTQPVDPATSCLLRASASLATTPFGRRGGGLFRLGLEGTAYPRANDSPTGNTRFPMASYGVRFDDPVGPGFRVDYCYFSFFRRDGLWFSKGVEEVLLSLHRGDSCGGTSVRVDGDPAGDSKRVTRVVIERFTTACVRPTTFHPNELGDQKALDAMVLQDSGLGPYAFPLLPADTLEQQIENTYWGNGLVRLEGVTRADVFVGNGRVEVNAIPVPLPFPMGSKPSQSFGPPALINLRSSGDQSRATVQLNLVMGHSKKHDAICWIRSNDGRVRLMATGARLSTSLAKMLHIDATPANPAVLGLNTVRRVRSRREVGPHNDALVDTGEVGSPAILGLGGHKLVVTHDDALLPESDGRAVRLRVGDLVLRRAPVGESAALAHVAAAPVGAMTVSPNNGHYVASGGTTLSGVLLGTGLSGVVVQIDDASLIGLSRACRGDNVTVSSPARGAGPGGLSGRDRGQAPPGATATSARSDGGLGPMAFNDTIAPAPETSDAQSLQQPGEPFNLIGRPHHEFMRWLSPAKRDAIRKHSLDKGLDVTAELNQALDELTQGMEAGKQPASQTPGVVTPGITFPLGALPQRPLLFLSGGTYLLRGVTSLGRVTLIGEGPDVTRLVYLGPAGLSSEDAPSLVTIDGPDDPFEAEHCAPLSNMTLIGISTDGGVCRNLIRVRRRARFGLALEELHLVGCSGDAVVLEQGAQVLHLSHVHALNVGGALLHVAGSSVSPEGASAVSLRHISITNDLTLPAVARRVLLKAMAESAMSDLPDAIVVSGTSKATVPVVQGLLGRGLVRVSDPASAHVLIEHAVVEQVTTLLGRASLVTFDVPATSRGSVSLRHVSGAVREDDHVTLVHAPAGCVRYHAENIAIDHLAEGFFEAIALPATPGADGFLRIISERNVAPDVTGFAVSGAGRDFLALGGRVVGFVTTPMDAPLADLVADDTVPRYLRHGDILLNARYAPGQPKGWQLRMKALAPALKAEFNNALFALVPPVAITAAFKLEIPELLPQPEGSPELPGPQLYGYNVVIDAQGGASAWVTGMAVVVTFSAEASQTYNGVIVAAEQQSISVRIGIPGTKQVDMRYKAIALAGSKFVALGALAVGTFLDPAPMK